MDAGLPTGDADRRGARTRAEWQLCDTSRRTLAPLAPDALVHDRGDRPAWSLKLQVLRELAQHAGHADILRESIDGRTTT